MKRIFTFLFFLLLLPVRAGAAVPNLPTIPSFPTVTSSGTTRTVGPGKTHATVTAALAVASPGDIIDIYSATYDEAITITSDGDSTHWLTIQGAVGETVIITRTVADTTVVNFAATTDYVYFKNITVGTSDYVAQNWRAGIKITSADGDKDQYIYFDDVEVDGSVGAGNGMDGFRIGVSGSGSTHHLYFKDVTVHSHAFNGFTVYTGYNDFLLDNVVSHNNGGDGWSMSQDTGDNVYFVDSIARNNYGDGFDCGALTTVYKNCKSYGNGDLTAYAYAYDQGRRQGNAFKAWGHDVWFINCLVYDIREWKCGFDLKPNRGDNANYYMLNCTSACNNIGWAMKLEGYSTVFLNTANLYMYNNIFWGKYGATNIVCERWDDNWTILETENNYYFGSASTDIAWQFRDYTPPDFTNATSVTNYYLSDVGDAGWVTAGFDAQSFQRNTTDHGLADPGFTSLVGDDYTLALSSLAKDAAYDLFTTQGLNFDIDGNTRPSPTGGNADIGAYEYQSDVPPAGNQENITLFWRGEALDFDAANGTTDYSAGDDIADVNSGAVINTDANKVGINGIDCPSANDWVYLAAASIISNANNFRIGKWYRPIALLDGYDFLRIYDSVGGGYIVLALDSVDDDEIRVLYYDSAESDWDETTVNLNLLTNTWSYIELSLDATDGNTGEVWVNGVSVLDTTGIITDFTPNFIAIGNYGNDVSFDSHFDGPIIVSSDPDKDLYALRDTVDYEDLATSTFTITDTGIIEGGAFVSDKTETWNTADTNHTIALKLSCTTEPTATDLHLAYLVVKAGPETTDTTNCANMGIQLISGVYYLTTVYHETIGGRSTDFQTNTAATALVLNGATLSWGAISLTTTLSTEDIGDITLAVPYPSPDPKMFTSTSTLAAAQAAGFYAIPDDFLGVTDANAIGVANMSSSHGTSGHPITLNGGGLTHPGSQTFGDYWTITRVIHGSTVVLGASDTHKYSLIPVGDILQVPEGATGCTIHDDGIRGTLDLDETVTVKNTWVTTVDLAGVETAETATFNNCAFEQTEIAIDATLGVGGATSFDAQCQFSITTADCFRNYATADFHLTAGSPLKDAGEDTGADVDLDGRVTPIGTAHDIGPYELPRSGGSSTGTGTGLKGYCPCRQNN